jgi:hypothetical protein
MRRWLFPLLVLLLVVLAALLLWAWSTDAVLKSKCAQVDGAWNVEARTCTLTVTTIRP